jgi:H+/Cl- antiporter ClcA
MLARKAALSLSLLAFGVAAGLFEAHEGRKLSVFTLVPLFVGAFMSVSMLHHAWADISTRDIPRRRRWKLRAAMAFISPIAGPLYWLLHKDDADVTGP